MDWEGKITYLPEEITTSKNGNTYTHFGLDHGSKYFKVFVFGEKAQKIMALELKGGERVKVVGYIKESNSKSHESDVQSIFANEVLLPERGGQSATQKAEQDPERKRKAIRIAREKAERSKRERLARGEVRVWKANRWQWKRQQDCIFVPDEGWKDPLEFAMDVLGGEKVTELSRGQDYNFRDAEKKKLWLKELVELAICECEKPVQWAARAD